MSTPLYPNATVLKHKVRGSIHMVLKGPDQVREESTWKPGYLYTCGDFVTIREQAEMEDGRFEVHTPEIPLVWPGEN